MGDHRFDPLEVRCGQECIDAWSSRTPIWTPEGGCAGGGLNSRRSFASRKVLKGPSKNCACFWKVRFEIRPSSNRPDLDLASGYRSESLVEGRVPEDVLGQGQGDVETDHVVFSAPLDAGSSEGVQHLAILGEDI